MFPWTDAWLLQSLIYAREPADRDRMRAVGDYICHAIFTDEELDGGLDRLMRAGHVVAVGDRFAPSPQVLGWHAAGKKRTSVLKDLERVQAFLDAPAPGATR